jgi:hypothetical protein
MDKTKSSPEVSDLNALINEMIAYWKTIAWRIFKEIYPFSEPEEFEQRWPQTLDTFFLMETVSTAKALRRVSKGRDN